MPQPVILLAFANDRADSADRTARYLQLPQEKTRIREALAKAEWRGIELEVVTNATPSGLFDRLGEVNDRVIGVHFGGHATDEGLALEDADGRPRLLRHGGLARRIGGLPQLRWVFLNGCGTKPHVEAIHRFAQVPVIATSTAIRDDAAVVFSRRFYFALAHEATLEDAFERAESEMEGQPDGPLGCVRDGAAADAVFTRMLEAAEGDEPVRCPWVLVPPAEARDTLQATIYAPLIADAPADEPDADAVQDDPPPDEPQQPDDPPPDPITGPPAWLRPVLGGGAALVAAVLGLSAIGGNGSDDDEPDARAPIEADQTPPLDVDEGADIDRPLQPIEGRLPATPNRPAAVELGGEGQTPRLWFAATPVTRAQYLAVIGELPQSAGERAPDDAPVTGVSHADAEAYCTRLNLLEKHKPGDGWQLPSEGEWMAACRAGGEGSPLPEEAEGPRPVGRAANPWGISDMLGVVNQWTRTTRPAPSGPPGSPPNHILKGGHPWTAPDDRTCEARWSEPAHHRDQMTGLRIVRPVPR